jgi:hypothetical protein
MAKYRFSPVRLIAIERIGQTVYEHDDKSWLGTIVELSDDGELAKVNWGHGVVAWTECRDLRTGFEQD